MWIDCWFEKVKINKYVQVKLTLAVVPPGTSSVERNNRMSLSETAESLNAFLESYRIAFEQMDAPAIAEHFAYPSHVTSDTGEIVLIPIADKSDWIGQIERLLDMYRAIDFGSARVLDLAPTELSPRLVQAILHWELQDSMGRSLYDFQAVYTLVKISDALRIAAISHNEIPRYREALARLQSQRALGGDAPG